MGRRNVPEVQITHVAGVTGTEWEGTVSANGGT